MRKLARTARGTRRISTHLVERGARRHFRKLLNYASDELMRTAVKASLSGVATVALYWWHHHR